MHKGIPHLHSGTPTVGSPEVDLAIETVSSSTCNLEKASVAAAVAL